AELDADVPAPHRVQDRTEEVSDVVREFRNAPDSDPSIAVNREWARGILTRARSSELGSATVSASTLGEPAQINDLVADTVQAGAGWADVGAKARAAVLRRAAMLLERRRGDLIEVMAAEAGKTFDQADPEVSEAIDFASYYAARALDLEHL